MDKHDKETEKAFEKGGADAEEALHAIRVVKAFGQESLEIEKFDYHLKERTSADKKQSIFYGLIKALLVTFYSIPVLY